MNKGYYRYGPHREFCNTVDSSRDFDLWRAAKAILLGNGLVSEKECHGASSLPFLLKKVEELRPADFQASRKYIPSRELRDCITRWYDDRRNGYKYARLREYNDLNPSSCHDEELWERMKAKYPAPSKTRIASRKSPKRKRSPIDITLPRPAYGCFYTDDEQWNIIKKYPKGSFERGEVVRLMVTNKYVKSSSTLRRHIKQSEEKDKKRRMRPPHQLQIIQPKDIGLGYCGEYIRPAIREVVRWKGSIILSVIPVSFGEMDQNQDSLDTSCLQTIDICSIIGNSDEVVDCLPGYGNVQDGTREPCNSRFATLCRDKSLPPLNWRTGIHMRKEYVLENWDKCKDIDFRKRITKLYFHPAQYPPQINGTDQYIIKGRLRYDIQTAAEVGGSPVVCVGDSDLEIRFRCKKWYRRRIKPNSEKQSNWHPYNMHSCTFTFVVRWDQYGYYIPLLNDRLKDHNMGCSWHCC